MPSDWIDRLIAQGGWAQTHRLRYPGAATLQRQTAAYFDQPLTAKLRDARPNENEAGYGQGAQSRQWLFVRDGQVPPQLAVQLTDLWAWCHALALACMTQLAAHLGLAPSVYLALVEPNAALPAQRNDNLLRMFHYAGRPNQPPGAQVLTAPHRDIGLLAIGLRTAPGLQVRQGPAGAWEDVERGLAPGEVVIMAGDSLAAVTNHRIPSCTHRVTSGPDGRISWVYHLRLKSDALLDAKRLTSAKTGPFPATAEPCLAGDFTALLLSTKSNANAPLPVPT